MERKRVVTCSSHSNSSSKRSKVPRFIPPILKTTQEYKDSSCTLNNDSQSPLLLPLPPTYSSNQLNDSLEEKKEEEFDEIISQSLCGSSQEVEDEDIQELEQESEGEGEDEEQDNMVTIKNTRWSHNSTHPLNINGYTYNGRNYLIKHKNKSHRNHTTDDTIKATHLNTTTSNVFDFPVSQINEKKSRKFTRHDKTVDRSASSDRAINDSTSFLNQSINNRSVEEQRAINAEVLRIVAETKAEIEERKQHYAELIAAEIMATTSSTEKSSLLKKDGQSSYTNTSALKKSLTQQELSFFLSGSEE